VKELSRNEELKRGVWGRTAKKLSYLGIGQNEEARERWDEKKCHLNRRVSTGPSSGKRYRNVEEGEGPKEDRIVADTLGDWGETQMRERRMMGPIRFVEKERGRCQSGGVRSTFRQLGKA